MTWSVYQIHCAANGCAYFGRSIDPESEIRKQLSRLRTSKHANVELQGSWDFYHPEDFSFDVLASGLSKDAADRKVEQLVVGALCDGLCFNSGVTAGADFRCRRHSEATKRKLALINTGLVRPHRRRVVVYGVAYESLTAAGRSVGLSPGSIHFRLRSPDWPAFQYADAG